MSSTDTKVVLVTGGSVGIGAAIAKAFSKQKVCLSLVALDEENFDEVIQECNNLGAKKVLKIVTDLTLKENMDMVMKKTIEEFGRLDVLINNAGTMVVGGIKEVTLDDIDKVMNINVKTPVYMTQLSIPYLEKSKGNIVNVSSLSTFVIVNHFLAYSLSKAAFDRLTKLSALDLASSGIRINSVNPPGVHTPLFGKYAEASGIAADVAVEIENSRNPLNKRMIEVEEVVDAVLFLASDKAKMITGVNLPVDGGRALTGQ